MVAINIGATPYRSEEFYVIVVMSENHPDAARIFAARQGSADAACHKASKEVLTQDCGKKTAVAGWFSDITTILLIYNN